MLQGEATPGSGLRRSREMVMLMTENCRRQLSGRWLISWIARVVASIFVLFRQSFLAPRNSNCTRISILWHSMEGREVAGKSGLRVTLVMQTSRHLDRPLGCLDPQAEAEALETAVGVLVLQARLQAKRSSCVAPVRCTGMTRRRATGL